MILENRKQSLAAAAALALFAVSITGCAFTVVRPAPLFVGSPERGNQHVVHYPAYVLVHDSESVRDAHQIKDNILGVTDIEIIRWADLGMDAVTPGPPHQPLENGVEWIRSNYANLPDIAPVRIVGGFFSAFGIEKTTPLGGGSKIAAAPFDPISYFAFTRVIYLTDWVQDTLGEANTGAGHLAPWGDKFVPRAATAPLNKAVDWIQFGLITGYIRIFRFLNNAADSAIDGGEAAWGGIVYASLWSTGTLNLATDDTKEKEPDVGLVGPGSRSK